MPNYMLTPMIHPEGESDTELLVTVPEKVERVSCNLPMARIYATELLETDDDYTEVRIRRYEDVDTITRPFTLGD